jgi:pilus assembly protein FimV
MICSHSNVVLQHEDAVLNTFQKTSLRATLIAATLAAMPLGVNAAGLGRISVMSALGQPLRAEIELTATADELGSMTAEVAAPTAFKDAGVAYAPAIGTIRMSVEKRGKRSFLKLTSTKPINDPFVDMLVELNWSAGRLLREYTFLLDPPDMPAPAAAANVGAPVSKPVARAARPIGRSASAEGGYRVSRGDTLGKIAREYKPAGVSMDQMLIALYQANPEAFVGDNINRLRAGVILNVPDEQAVAAVPAGQARQQVIAHAADFNAYRNRVAARVAQTAPAAAMESTQSSTGKITAKVEEAPSPITESKDQVKVSKTETGAPASGGDSTAMAESARRLQALEEDIVARDKALAEANDRLAALEKNISELQQLIEMKNESLAALQQQAQTAPVVTPPAEAAPAPAPVEAAPAPAAEAPAAAVVTEEKPEAAAPAGAQDALDKELQDLVKRPENEENGASQAATPSEPPAATEPAPAPAPEPAPAPKAVVPPPVPEPVAEPSFLESLADNPATLYGGGAAILALLGFGLYRSRKSRSASNVGDETAMASVFPPDQNSVFGETGGQSVDTGSSSLIQTDFSQSGLSAIDADEGVDPVAEADVYMAYGRDAQAEEILLDAMKADPSRTAVHLKLLEIYAHRKNLKQFETTAAELYTVTNGQGEDWDKAVEMGLKLDPDNPLFSRGPKPAMEAEEPAGTGFSAPRSDVGAVAATAAVGAAAAAALADDAAAEESPADAKDEEIDALASNDFDEALDFSASIPSVDEPSPSQLKDTWAIPGDLNQFTDSDLQGVADSANVQNAVAGLKDEEVAGLDTGDLDFNLDLDEPVTEESPEAKAEAVPEEDALEAFEASESALEFNIDLSEPPPANDSMAGVAGGGEIDLEKTDAGGTTSGIDFQSAFSHSETVDETLEASEQDGNDMAVVDLEKTNFDGSLLDFDFELDDDKAAAGDQELMATSLDLSDINLDLEGADVPELPEEAGAAEAAPDFDLAAGDAALPEDVSVPEAPWPEEELPELSAAADSFHEQPPVQAPDPEEMMMASLTKSVVTSLTDSRAVPDLPADEELNQEVDTKLELARAYEEMGDGEGARELLDEVMRDGDASQQEQARSILARLG